MNEFASLAASSSFTPAIVSLCAGLTATLFAVALATLRPTRRQRVSTRVAGIRAASLPYASATSPFQDRRISTIPIVEALFRGRNWTVQTRDALARAGVPLRVGEYLALRALAITGGTAVGIVLANRAGGDAASGVLFPSIGAAIGFFTPSFVVSRRLRHRHAMIETQLVELCDIMASMLRSGYGYAQALTQTAAEVGAPLSLELRRLLDTVRLGGDIDEALDDLNNRLQSRDFDMVASAIAIQRRSGGNLAEILEGVASTIRQRQSFHREVRAITSKERFSAMFVASFPIAIIIVLTLMARETYGLLFTDPVGRLILGIALTLDAIGFFIIHKLVRIEV